MEEGFHKLEEAKAKVFEKEASLYRECMEMGVAAVVLMKSLWSMLSSANEEAKLGLKMRVAALLADLAGANESRRRTIVVASGGAVVDWLFDMLSSPSTSPLTQAKAARALSFLISDSATCKAVLARPLAISHLFHFINSIHPHSAKNYEGAVAEGGCRPSIWDAYTHKPGNTYDGSNGDVAMDQYHRYLEDVKLMADMGMNAYRFSIAWSRLIPNGSGEVNREGVDFLLGILH